ncbi:MAG: hypothetical protein Q7J84_11270 [Sulfuricaulis sp.]|nr:hypothetical protein [Sulfuricaulis sp.]
MDSGIWATWYNLDNDDRADFLDWLHAEYLPHLKQRHGFSWVAHYAHEGGGEATRELCNILARSGEDVACGGQFLLLVGAPSPHTFFAPNVMELTWPQGVAKRLAQRRDVVSAIFMEEARVNGPEFGRRIPGGPPGPAIQMGAFRMRSVEDEFALGAWYAQNRLPAIARIPGAIGARKLIAVAGWPKNGILYEFTSLAARLEHFEGPEEREALDPKEWTGKIVQATIHMPGSPMIGARTWPPLDQA